MADSMTDLQPSAAVEQDNDKENNSAEQNGMHAGQNDGKRVRQLEAAINKALEKTLKSCTYNHISQYFRETTEEQDGLLQSAFERIQDFLHESMHDELNMLLDETNLRNKLNELDLLIEQTPADTAASSLPRERIDPASLIRAQVIPIKQAYKAELLAQLQQATEQNEVKKKQLMEQRHQLKDMFAQIEDMSRELTVAAELCEAIPRAQLQYSKWVEEGLVLRKHIVVVSRQDRPMVAEAELEFETPSSPITKRSQNPPPRAKTWCQKSVQLVPPEAMSTMELINVQLDIPADANIIFGQSHFIKTVEDLHEIMVGISATVKFGLAFCEASGDRLIRHSGNDEDLLKVAIKNAQLVAAGHTFIIVMRNAFPVNFLNAVKACPEVCRIFCATANAVQVILAVSPQGRGVLGVIDGEGPLGVEGDTDIEDRRKFLRTIGYKL